MYFRRLLGTAPWSSSSAAFSTLEFNQSSEKARSPNRYVRATFNRGYLFAPTKSFPHSDAVTAQLCVEPPVFRHARAYVWVADPHGRLRLNGLQPELPGVITNSNRGFAR